MAEIISIAASGVVIYTGLERLIEIIRALTTNTNLQAQKDRVLNELLDHATFFRHIVETDVLQRLHPGSNEAAGTSRIRVWLHRYR